MLSFKNRSHHHLLARWLHSLHITRVTSFASNFYFFKCKMIISHFLAWNPLIVFFCLRMIFQRISVHSASRAVRSLLFSTFPRHILAFGHISFLSTCGWLGPSYLWDFPLLVSFIETLFLPTAALQNWFLFLLESPLRYHFLREVLFNPPRLD